MKSKKSIQNNSNYIHKHISTYKKSGSCIDHSYKYISLYTWSNLCEVNKQFGLFQRNKNIDSLVRESMFIPKELNSNYSHKSFIAQTNFGSLSRWWTAQCKNKAQLLYWKRKIKERHNSINYFIENLQIESDISTLFSQELSFLTKETKMTSKLKNNQKYVGWYPGAKISTKLILSFPFEILYSIELTFVRIMTITFWNEITSCPVFIEQTSLNNIVVFSVKSLKNFYCKWVNFYLIIIANICKFPKIGGDSSTENKLHLIIFTKNIIKKWDWKIKVCLLPKIPWRGYIKRRTR